MRQSIINLPITISGGYMKKSIVMIIMVSILSTFATEAFTFDVSIANNTDHEAWVDVYRHMFLTVESVPQVRLKPRTNQTITTGWFCPCAITVSYPFDGGNKVALGGFWSAKCWNNSVTISELDCLHHDANFKDCHPVKWQ
jgi:hypothetical protein